MKPLNLCVAGLALLLCTWGATAVSADEPAAEQAMAVAGESLVLAGNEPARLLCRNLVPGSVVVRSRYLADAANVVVYEAGRDYAVDAASGTLWRTAGSRIPNFADNAYFGKEKFDHTKFPGASNHGFFVWVDYKTESGFALAQPTDQSLLLKRSREKLLAGGPFKLIAFGDSISAGGEASAESLRFQNRYGQWLAERFPEARIAVENGATGGDATVQGLDRLEEKVLSREPDLVLVAFGMNDHNVPPFGVAPEAFEANLTQIVQAIQKRTDAEVILLSTFPPNPRWAFGSHRMDLYAQATARVAKQLNCAFADLHAVWTNVLQRKDAPSLLGNNINHPNDFGHWLYLQALQAVQF